MTNPATVKLEGIDAKLKNHEFISGNQYDYAYKKNLSPPKSRPKFNILHQTSYATVPIKYPELFWKFQKKFLSLHSE
jgi:hypothetical protein